MNSLTRVCAILLFTAVSAPAAIIRVVPPAPDEFDSVKVDVGGIWGDSCVPNRPTVTISRNRVDIAFPSPYRAGIGCLTSTTPWAERVNLGILPAGIYEIVATVASLPAPVEVGRSKLIVRGSAPFIVSPFGAPISGGQAVDLNPRQAIDVSSVTTVRFGGVPAAIKYAALSTLTVEVPPHVAGPVDVEIGPLADGSTVREIAAFDYFDPAAPPDPFVHRPILVPLSYSGSGAFGSSWTIDNVIAKGLFKNALPCEGCGPLITSPVRLRTEPVGTGYLLYGVRDDPTRDPLHRSYHLNSRLRAASADEVGTEVPIVEEEDFQFGNFMLLNVPGIRNARATLRIYATSPGLSCYATTIGSALHNIFLTRFADDRPFFGAIDLTADLQRFAPDASESVYVTCSDVTVPFWTMLTITDNRTQHVTIISPE